MTGSPGRRALREAIQGTGPPPPLAAVAGSEHESGGLEVARERGAVVAHARNGLVDPSRIGHREVAGKDADRDVRPPQLALEARDGGAQDRPMVVGE